MQLTVQLSIAPPNRTLCPNHESAVDSSNSDASTIKTLFFEAEMIIAHSTDLDLSEFSAITTDESRCIRHQTSVDRPEPRDVSFGIFRLTPQILLFD
jgi:hypothetical protein